MAPMMKKASSLSTSAFQIRVATKAPKAPHANAAQYVDHMDIGRIIGPNSGPPHFLNSGDQSHGKGNQIFTFLRDRCGNSTVVPEAPRRHGRSSAHRPCEPHPPRPHEP